MSCQLYAMAFSFVDNTAGSAVILGTAFVGCFLGSNVSELRLFFRLGTMLLVQLVFILPFRRFLRYTKRQK